MKRYWTKLTICFIAILVASVKYIANFIVVSQELND
jgi:hypothetical protein